MYVPSLLWRWFGNRPDCLGFVLSVAYRPVSEYAVGMQELVNAILQWARDFITGIANVITVTQPEYVAGLKLSLNIHLVYLPSSPNIRVRSDDPETTAPVSEGIHSIEASLTNWLKVRCESHVIYGPLVTRKLV